MKKGSRKEIGEVELYALGNSLQMRANHSFGISVISLNVEQAMELREEIDEWLAENRSQRVNQKSLEKS
ncbi:MAG: hypothetical protein ACYCQJ_00250 [Nitrososphaerales archaeon]